MSGIVEQRTPEVEKKMAVIAGLIVMALWIFIFILMWGCFRWMRPEPETVQTSAAVVSHFAHERESGPVTIGQSAWLQCPAIDPTRQKINVHIDETTVWIDWIIDGRFYREKPKYFPDHEDFMGCRASSIKCRVTPGTAVRTATAHVTITDYNQY